ncbi:MAG: hypothetical protein HQ514_12295 [Rhodospirillales bacterium]|nr:hypothetical protein [Rhodospirillales bacterium]
MPDRRKTLTAALTEAAAAVDNELRRNQLTEEDSKKAARKLALLQGIAAQVELMQNQNDDQDGN